MSIRRVVWTEGLFLRPQHFQQHDRFLEAYVDGRVVGLRANSWGLASIQLEEQLLSIGKFAIRSAKGVFPDGTPFSIPDADPVPAALEIEKKMRDQTIYLSLPLRRAGADDVSRGDDRMSALTRYVLDEEDQRDTFTGIDSSATMEVAALSIRLTTDANSSEGYARIPIARLEEKRSDGQVILDSGFIPTVVRSAAAEQLSSYLKEIEGLLHQRGEGLGARVAAGGIGGASELADSLRLQIINRNEPVVADLASAGTAHPEEVYHLLIALAGELATFSSGSKRPPRFPVYCHEDLRSCFEPLMNSLRSALTDMTAQAAVAIKLKPRQAGIFVGTVGERSLLSTARFILAASADMPEEDIRDRLPSVSIIGPRLQERFYEIVGDQVRGVPIRPVSSVPREIPFYERAAYFSFDQASPYWQEVENAGGIAIYVPEQEFPGLKLEAWAIRSKSE